MSLANGPTFIPPQDVEAEERLIGCLEAAGCLGLETFERTLAAVREHGLSASDFYSTKLGHIFSTTDMLARMLKREQRRSARWNRGRGARR